MDQHICYQLHTPVAEQHNIGSCTKLYKLSVYGLQLYLKVYIHSSSSVPGFKLSTESLLFPQCDLCIVEQSTLVSQQACIYNTIISQTCFTSYVSVLLILWNDLLILTANTSGSDTLATK